MRDIIFSGGSHYGNGALHSIQKCFDRVYIHESTPDFIKGGMRESDVIIRDFDDADCNYVFLAGHADLISGSQLSKKVYINVHGALLPKYRGMHSTFWAIMNGEKQLGITFHLVDEGMDSGPILKQYSFEYSGQPVSKINMQIDELVAEHSGSVLCDYLDGKLKPIPQDDSIATFGARRNLDDCVVDFNMPNMLLRRFFHALTPPYPLPRIYIKSKLYEITSYEIEDRNYYGATGRCVNIDRRGIWIKTADGFLIVKELAECESGAAVDPSTLIKIGYRF